MASDARDDLVKHIGPLRAFAIGLAGNPALADDLVQDTLVKAWTNIDKFQTGTNMRAWLITILRNTYYSIYRKRRREVADVDGTYTAALCSKPDHDGRLNLRDMMAAFNKLPDTQREALALVGVEGFSYEEAAQTCNVAIGTIKSRVGRARQNLAELMQLDDMDQMELTDQVTAGIVGLRASTA